MEQTKKSSNVALIVILVILVLGLGGYIVYDKFIAKDEPTTIPSNDKTEGDNEEKPNDVTNEVDKTTAEKLMKMVTIPYVEAGSSNKDVTYYDAEKLILANELSDRTKLDIANTLIDLEKDCEYKE